MFEQAQDLAKKLCSALSSVIIGRDDTVKLIVTALIADGHVLIEDYPGSGKTTLVKTLGNLIESPGTSGENIKPFRRVQFTPDLLPGDVLGVNIFDAKTSTFRFVPGPVFAHILLADEINRTGPKVQSAFLECMAEKQVTIDNQTHKLDDLFFVVATQNPLDIAGTYPLPIVQLDRFLFKIPMSYVDRANEIQILGEHDRIQSQSSTIKPVCSRDEIIKAREAKSRIHIAPAVREAIVDIVQKTRGNPILQYGASTRAAVSFQDAVKAWAIVQGRTFVTEEDLVNIAPHVFLHRLRFHGGAGDPKVALAELIKEPIEKLIKTLK